MNTHVNKTKEQKSQSISEQKSIINQNEQAFQFVDKRPEAVLQRKLIEIANNSSRVKQLGAFQKMANHYSETQEPPIQKKENKTGLPDNLKAGIESLSGYAMDDVKVHYNSDKPAQLNAHAYAQGTDIHLGSGQEKHLPHEAWHVVQQKQGRVKPTMQMKEKVNINDDEGLEKEADVMGAKAKNFSIKQEDTSILQAKQISTNKVTQLATWVWDPGKSDWVCYDESYDPSKKPTHTGSPGNTFDDETDEVPEVAAAVEEEESDIKKEYKPRLACALQALIQFGHKPFGLGSAQAVHDHIWATPDLAKFQEYDVKWESLYRHLGFTKVANPPATISGLSQGNYLCEVNGHMVNVKVSKGSIEIREDSSNDGRTKEKDTIIKLYTRAS